MKIAGATMALAAGLLELSLVLGAAVEKRQMPGSAKSEDIVSQRMCYWGSPETALVRDTIYINGGTIGMKQFLKDSTVNYYADDLSNYEPLLYYINLTQPFTKNQVALSQTSLIHNETKLGQGVAPRTINGHLLSNDYEIISFGGVMEDSASYNFPLQNWAFAKDIYQHGAVPLPRPGESRDIVLAGVTRDVAAGAYVSVPSENLAFVFGGSRNENWGEIRTDTPPEYEAGALSRQLISADLAQMRAEKWVNKTMVDIPARTSAGMVWLPVGAKGSLVAFGGTVMDLSTSTTVDKATLLKYNAKMASMKTQGSNFMKVVHVYDIENSAWFDQQTSGDIPPPTADFCSVVASSQDGTSHQIYIYGGYSGLTFNGYRNTNANNVLLDQNYDHVYVLSIPSFNWTKVYEGESPTGRRGHRCHKISDSEMMVIGGVAVAIDSKSLGGCLVDEFIRVFNLNTLVFMDEYNPEKQDSYKIPQKITAIIGGDQTGKATLIAPAQWGSKDLSNLMSTKYPGTVKNYWPFKAVTDPTAPPNNDSTGPNNGSALPKYVPPLLGAILGLLVVITLLCCILFYLRRRKQKQKRMLQSDSGASTVVRKRQTWSWIMGASGDEKGDVGEDRDYFNPKSDYKTPFDSSTIVGSPGYEAEAPGDGVVHEMHTSEIHEMLGDTGQKELDTVPSSQRRVTISDRVEEIGRGHIRQPSNSSNRKNSVLSTVSSEPSRRKDSILSTVSSEPSHRKDSILSTVSSEPSRRNDSIMSIASPIPNDPRGI